LGKTRIGSGVYTMSVARFYKVEILVSISYRIKNLGVIFDKRITWILHIKMIQAKAFRTFENLLPIEK
jgi:hypothetical protein